MIEPTRERVVAALVAADALPTCLTIDFGFEDKDGVYERAVTTLRGHGWLPSEVDDRASFEGFTIGGIRFTSPVDFKLLSPVEPQSLKAPEPIEKLAGPAPVVVTVDGVEAELTGEAADGLRAAVLACAGRPLAVSQASHDSNVVSLHPTREGGAGDAA